MTVKDTMEAKLVEHMLWPKEAAMIVKLAQDSGDFDKNIKWNDHTDGYPPEFLAVLFAGVKRHAILWLEANAPKHFALFTLSH